MKVKCFKNVLIVFLCFYIGQYLFAGQPVLLPEPQQIKYGDGKVYLTKEIHFVSSIENEDRNVILELQKVFNERHLGKVVLSNSKLINGIEFNRTGAPDPLPGIDEKAGIGQREYYKIKSKENLITITSPSSAGLFYALQTLRQLIKEDDKGAYISEVIIEDWPSMPYRGFMMDMTHMQLPTVDEIKRQIDFLAKWKGNQYYFYSETNIELDGYPLLAQEARYTKENIREIVEYASSKFVDVIPNINLYGHLHDLFKFEHYAHLSITPYGREFNSTNLQRGTIIDDWLKQFAKMFPSPFMHIGFDEAWLIDKEAKRLNQPAEKLFLDMLNSTLPKVVDLDKKPMIYTDMLYKYQPIIESINENFVAVPWYYTPRELARYSDYFKPFGERGIPFFVQSATLNYYYVYPAYTLSLENHRRMFSEGLKNGSTGFIMSGWTDDTQALLRTSRPDMAFGAAISWNYKNSDDSTFYRDYSKTAFSSISIGENWLEAHTALVEAERLTREVFGITTDASRVNPFSQKAQEKFMKSRKKLRQARLLVEKARVCLKEEVYNDDDRVTFEAMFASAKGLELLTTRYLFAGRMIDVHLENQNNRNKKEYRGLMREIVGFVSSMTVDLYDVTVEAKEAYRQAWHNEYTSYRWGVASAKFDRELLFWLRVKDKLVALQDIPEDEELPSLSTYLDLNY